MYQVTCLSSRTNYYYKYWLCASCQQSNKMSLTKCSVESVPASDLYENVLLMFIQTSGQSKWLAPSAFTALATQDIYKLDPMTAFTEFIVCLIGQFAVGEDVQKPFFYIYFPSSQSFQICHSLAQMKQENSGVMFSLLASFFSRANPC